MFEVKNKELFFSEELGNYLDMNYRKLYRKIRKQLPDSNFTKSLRSNLLVGEETMRIILIVSFVMSFFMSGGLKYMVALIRSL